MSALFPACRRLLLLVSELHANGYQRIRIAPGMSPSGGYWRCAITPASNISREHGAMMVADVESIVARYSSGDGGQYFGWRDIGRATPARLARMFIERFPDIARAGKGSDWMYAGWYQEMLGVTHPDLFPIAYADWDLPTDWLATTGGRRGVDIPMPPPGEAIR